MQLSRLHEAALDALVPPPSVSRAAESEVQIEVIWEADDIDELAVTGQFVRFSAPYERVEIEHVPAVAANARVRPTTVVRTVPNGRPTTPMPMPVPNGRPTTPMPVAMAPAATVPFDRVWFEADGDGEELQIEPPKWRRLLRSWTWLLISLAAGGAAVAYMASL
jgi:hypothetical protein